MAALPAGSAVAAGSAGGGLLGLLREAQLTPAYLAFTAYVFAVISYRLPIGTAAMTIALLTLPIERGALRFPPVAAWVLALLCWAAVGYPSSIDQPTTWDALIEFAKVCAVVVVGVNVLTTRARLQLFMVAVLTFFALYPLRGAIFNYFIYGGTVQGRAVWNYTFANPNDLAAFCILQLSLAAGMIAAGQARWIRIAAVAGAVLTPILIVLTQSRGAFVALAVVAAVILRTYWRRGRVLLLFVAVGLGALMIAPESVWNRFGTIGSARDIEARQDIGDSRSAEQRLEIWRVARTIIAEHPVTGVGWGAYPTAHHLYAQRPAFDPIALGRRDSHSTYFTIAAETGIPGLLIFLALVLSVYLHAGRTRRRAATLHPAESQQLYFLQLGLLGYLVAGIWGSYGAVVLTYLHLTILHAATHTLEARLRATAVRPAVRSFRVRGGARVAAQGMMR